MSCQYSAQFLAGSLVQPHCALPLPNPVHAPNRDCPSPLIPVIIAKRDEYPCHAKQWPTFVAASLYAPFVWNPPWMLWPAPALNWASWNIWTSQIVRWPPGASTWSSIWPGTRLHSILIRHQNNSCKVIYLDRNFWKDSRIIRNILEDV